MTTKSAPGIGIVRVAILYRVVQNFRAPVFERLARQPGYAFKVFYGCDFPGTKVVSKPGPFGFRSKKMTSVPIRLPTGRSDDALAPFSPFLFFELMNFKPDVIVCEGGSNLPNNIVAFLYSMLFRKPFIQWGLGEIKNRKKSKLRKILDRIIVPMERHSDAIIAYSTQGAGYYKRIGVPSEKIVVATNVVDTDNRLADIENVEKESVERMAEFNILYVGALQQSKNVELLIRAYARLTRIQTQTASLRIVGDGPHRKSLEALVRDLGASNVRFEGAVHEGISKFFLGADVFVLPGLGGLAVSDALIHSLPVICTIGDGCEADLIVNGHNGFYEPDLSEDLLVERLIYLIKNPQHLKQMKYKARELSLIHI
ncbi:glycosyltransferase family 4 protein [Synechococcus moorigangaii CMS01]|nr:glycosyltransferase family 4 protein [Synechococcus moorigangaii CMS01]